MGLLDNPRDEALLTLGLGLLNSKGSFGNALGQAGMQSLQALNQAKDRQRVDKMRALQEEMTRMNLETARRQQEQQARMEQFRASLQSPQEQNIGQAMAGGGGPSTANAAKLQPQDPNQNLMFGAMKAGLIDPVQYIQSQQKDNTPISVAEGTTLLNRKTMQPIFQNARADKDDEFVRRMKAAGIDPSSPLGRSLLMDKLKKDSTHSPAVQVSYGAPVAGVDETGKPVYFQPDKTGGKPAIIPGVAPPKKDTPAGLQEKLAQNAVTLGKIDKALTLVDRNPGSLGLQNYLGDPVMQRVDPSGIEVRAMIADIGGQKIHDRSGAAVTVGEAERLKPYIPAATDSPDAVKQKLKLFRAEYASMQQAIQSGASVHQAAQKGGLPSMSDIDAEIERRRKGK